MISLLDLTDFELDSEYEPKLSDCWALLSISCLLPSTGSCMSETNTFLQLSPCDKEKEKALHVLHEILNCAGIWHERRNPDLFFSDG